MKQYQPKSILVTGGAGFIGSHFIRLALMQQPNVNIVNIDKLTYAGSLENLYNLPSADRYHFIQGDICDSKLVRHILLHHQIDTIVHFAAESHVDRSIDSPAHFVTTNLLGTFTLLEAARHQWLEVAGLDSTRCRFHHISTDEVFGSLNIDDPLFTEKTAYQPRSPYSATKAGSDHLVHAYHHTYGLPITLSNCSNNYGPNQHHEKFIPTIIRACIEQKPIPIYGNGKNIRDWLYVVDHCHALLSILENAKSGASYNIGGNNEWENLAIANYICQQFDQLRPRKKPYADLLQFVHDRPGHDFRYAIDSSKIMQELGWTPKEDLASGIQKTIQHYLMT